MHTDTLQLVNEVPAEYVFGLDMGLTAARARNLTTHAAAHEVARERVRAAMMLRGQIPAGAR